MISCFVSGDLLSVLEFPTACRTSVLQFVFVIPDVLLPVFFNICGKRITYVTLIFNVFVALSMHYQIRFSHKPSPTSLIHTLMGSDGSMNDFMLVKLTLEGKHLATGLAWYLFPLLMFILMRLECRGYVEHFVAHRAQKGWMFIPVMFVQIMYTIFYFSALLASVGLALGLFWLLKFVVLDF